MGNLVKNCTENFLSEEGTVKGSPNGSGDGGTRRCSSDSGNSSCEDYPFFIGKECREFLENASCVSQGNGLDLFCLYNENVGL